MRPDESPPAIVQTAEQDFKWDLHVKAAIGYAKRSHDLVLQAGAEMLRAKMATPPGMWLKTLAKHGLAKRTAQFWLESFASFSKDASVADLNKIAERMPVAGGEEELTARQLGDEPEDHPLLKILLCKSCRRKGAVRDCKNCLKARQEFVGKGGRRSNKNRGGKLRFDWAKLEPHLSSIYQFPGRVVKAYPDVADDADYRDMVSLLQQLSERIKRVREKLRAEK